MYGFQIPQIRESGYLCDLSISSITSVMLFISIKIRRKYSHWSWYIKVMPGKVRENVPKVRIGLILVQDYCGLLCCKHGKFTELGGHKDGLIMILNV